MGTRLCEVGLGCNGQQPALEAAGSGGDARREGLDAAARWAGWWRPKERDTVGKSLCGVGLGCNGQQRALEGGGIRHNRGGKGAVRRYAGRAGVAKERSRRAWHRMNVPGLQWAVKGAEGGGNRRKRRGGVRKQSVVAGQRGSKKRCKGARRGRANVKQPR
ncbi:hypothetical protein B0H10DRAFT_2197425 [Mycena sp. CBHHK59/15]|nr:hypothetical protein B0H10DRAFT_2202868 [Mycena sp. CBHHK59/15]KAJ6576207.1 hypothetical protein B0H10DRAFT_2199170 [Mycena sp. CBHHK59/15]KAJ6591944.1 hypothetical protein B0H10DRAFT_2197425 [Mycena sp. CBHHK59/15]